MIETAKAFKEIDTDGNGTISFDEYFAYRAGKCKNVFAEQKAGFRKEFEMINKDGDGQLTQDEILAFALPPVNAMFGVCSY